MKFKVIFQFFLNRVEDLAGSLLNLTYPQTLLLEPLSLLI